MARTVISDVEEENPVHSKESSAEPVGRTPSEIWAGDLFKRREEAEQLLLYIESVVARPPLREDKSAYTIAVEAGYGEGKTFFLRRLAEHIGVRHPVAFVDAWADDLADEPLTALAATLNDALRPFMAQPAVQSRLRTFMVKTGKVARIAGLGLFKKAVGLAITAGGVEAISEVVSDQSEKIQDFVSDAVKDAAASVVDDVSGEVRRADATPLMQQRVASFEQGRRAVVEMKQSLEAVVQALDAADRGPPIIIIIDELDRCRPTYAVKLLEEIKHLFDVPGLVFILGLNSEQLAHSVAGAYGVGFNGRAYLRRFIDREYRMAEPELAPLLERLCANSGLSAGSFFWPPVAKRGRHSRDVSLPELLGLYMRAYGLRARDAFALVDILQTSVALAEGKRLHLAYLVPLAVGQMLGLPTGDIPSLPRPDWHFVVRAGAFGRESAEVEVFALAEQFKDASEMSDRELSEAMNSDAVPYPIAAVNEVRVWDANITPLWSVEGYPKLLTAVGRFKSASH